MRRTVKVLALVLALVLCLAAFAGCQNKAATPSAAPSASASTEPTTAPRTFTVGFDAEFAPYGYLENGEYVGFDLDLAQELCNRLGWTLVKQPIDWAAKDMELSSGSIDCIWNGFTITGREDEYTWTDAYIDNSQVFVVRVGSGIEKLTDLAGKDVETQADSTALAALTSTEDNDANLALAATFKSLSQVADYNTAFMDLETGLCDAICVDIGVANFQLANRSDKFVMLTEELSKEQYAVGFKLGNTELRDQVQTVMYAMLADGLFTTYAEKYSIDPNMICLGK